MEVNVEERIVRVACEWQEASDELDTVPSSYENKDEAVAAKRSDLVRRRDRARDTLLVLCRILDDRVRTREMLEKVLMPSKIAP